MQDFLFVSFFLGHNSGEDARKLLVDCDLLETAIGSPLNRNAWVNNIHFGVSLRLPPQDERLIRLLEKLRHKGINFYSRYDREYSDLELNKANWLIISTATAGLTGGADYGQTYSFSNSCDNCGAGAEPIPPLLADLGKMGKKDIDHLLYEGHFVISHRLADVFKDACLTGIDFLPVKSPRRPVNEKFWWLRVYNELPPMDTASTGYITEQQCPSCGRSGHYVTGNAPEVLKYNKIPNNATDFNVTWEYFGDWQQVRSIKHTRPVAGSRNTIVSQRVRQVFMKLSITRLVWTPLVVPST